MDGLSVYSKQLFNSFSSLDRKPIELHSYFVNGTFQKSSFSLVSFGMT